jgi:hypothetical protein
MASRKSSRTGSKSRKKTSRRKYGPKASQTVESAMHKYKRGKLKSGRSGRRAKSREQAIAIGLSEAREKGAKVPPAKGRKKSSRKRASTRARSTGGRKKSTRSRSSSNRKKS